MGGGRGGSFPPKREGKIEGERGEGEGEGEGERGVLCPTLSRHSLLLHV